MGARLLWVAVGAGLVVIGTLALGLVLTLHRGADAQAAGQGALVAGFVLLGAVAGLWYLAHLHLAVPAARLAAALRARATGTDAPLPQAPALGDLGGALDAVCAALTQAREGRAAAVRHETEALAKQRGLLETVLADLPMGLVLCTPDHRIAFFNAAAGLPGAGLDRPVFDALREAPLRQAHARLLATGDTRAATDLLCASPDGIQLFAARMRLLPPPAGYLLSLSDVTADHARHAAEGAEALAALEALRRPAAALAALTGVLEDAPPPLARALREEAQNLGRAVQALADRHEWQSREGLPHPVIRAADLADGLRARLEAQGAALTAPEAPLLLRCDGFEVIALLAQIARRIAAPAYRLILTPEATGATLRLHWQGAAPDLGTLDEWLDAPLDEALAGVTGRTVLAAHATDLWTETAGDGVCLCLPLVLARQTGPRPAPLARPAYDFALLDRTAPTDLENAPLASLSFVVFDSETTGLQPGKGDRLVQLAARRIVNGRMVPAEVFDTLVNPGIAIPAAATAVHGLTDAMVQAAPDPATAVRAFHRFAAGAILVAHHAPFDLAFLRAALPGVAFDPLVLDTVLLSALVYGATEPHDLDSLVARLGLTIPEEARHTALGDANVTAEALLRLLPMLEARGLTTIAALRDASRGQARRLGTTA